MYGDEVYKNRDPYYSGNYTVSVLDPENNLLYIYKFDS